MRLLGTMGPSLVMRLCDALRAWEALMGEWGDQCVLVVVMGYMYLLSSFTGLI